MSSRRTGTADSGASWNSGMDETAQIEIFNLNSDISGNDFAIDDISLRGPEVSR